VERLANCEMRGKAVNEGLEGLLTYRELKRVFHKAETRKKGEIGQVEPSTASSTREMAKREREPEMWREKG
jgi:hypothetical protein